MNGEHSKAPVAGAPQAGSALSPCDVRSGRTSAAAKPEARLMARVFSRCQAFIAAACAASAVPPEFLAALTANESGGDAKTARFEPAVYLHLKSVTCGGRPRYGAVAQDALGAEVADMLHPKSADFHARYLIEPFDYNHQRELATSWGFTQIMGYHMVGRGGTVRDLLDPAVHFRVALELLGEFAQEYQLDPAHEFAEMFRCWNTGRPYGQTYDPHYVERGLARASLYRGMAAAFAGKPANSQEGTKES
jgi:hypothetical protein